MNRFERSWNILRLSVPWGAAEPGNWSELQQHLAHLCDVFKIWRRQHGSSASQRWWPRKGRADGQCDRLVAEGGSDRDVLLRLVEVLATLS